MRPWVILLRGINVGGHNKLPMADLRAALTGAGFTNVKTYIQSGNVILQACESKTQIEVEKDVKALLKTTFDMDISVMVLKPTRLQAVMGHNPFGQSFESPNFMFVFFLGGVPENPDLSVLEGLRTPNDKISLMDDIFYAYIGDGAGRSKMFGKIERCLGVPATARNWRTLEKLMAMAGIEHGNT